MSIIKAGAVTTFNACIWIYFFLKLLPPTLQKYLVGFNSMSDSLTCSGLFKPFFIDLVFFFTIEASFVLKTSFACSILEIGNWYAH